MKVFAKFSLVMAAIFLFAFSGCSEEDLNSIQIQLNEDGSGELIYVESRIFDNASTTVDNNLRGMDWADKGIRMRVRQATFKKAEHLDFAGIKAEAKDKRFRLRVPLGKKATWAGILVPEQTGAEKIRKDARNLGFSVSRKNKRVFKFVVVLPGKVVAQGTSPKLAQTAHLIPAASDSPHKAELVIPVEKVLESDDEELLWEVTWK